EDRLRAAFLDAADVAGVMMVDLALPLAAGEHDLCGVDDDDVVAAIDVRRVGRQVLAAQAHRDQRREPADDQTLGVDQNPLLLDFGGLRQIAFHDRFSVEGDGARRGDTGQNGFYWPAACRSSDLSSKYVRHFISL